VVLDKDSNVLCKGVVILQPAQKHNINKERKADASTARRSGGRVG
jgi:hypothetical protein